jgi:prepilin-type N-terminal cleavage/methylation domain-containing protein
MFSKKHKTAYSLVELSVVITIMSILMMGVASIVNNSMTKAQKNETQEKMQIIYNAMGKFLLRNQKLPCPAPLNLAENTDGYGNESRSSPTSTTCLTTNNVIFSNENNIFVGAVPTTTLGLTSDIAKDEFGNKILYIVSSNAITQTTLASGTPAIFPSGDNGFGATNYTVNTRLNVFEYSNRLITNQAIFTLISHGNNQHYAYPANGTKPAQSCPDTSNDETTNSCNKYNAKFNNLDIIYSSNDPNFDDIILYKTKNQIAFDFNAHHLMLCFISNSQFILYGTKATATARNSSQSIFYEQNLFHSDRLNSCQLICGKYSMLFLSNPNCS